MLALWLKHPRQSNKSVHNKEANKFFTDFFFFTSSMALQAQDVCWNWTRSEFKFIFRTYYNNKPKQQLWRNKGRSWRYLIDYNTNLKQDASWPSYGKKKHYAAITLRLAYVTSPILTSRTKTSDCWRGQCLDKTKGNLKGIFPFSFR